VLAKKFQEAWNNNDASALAALFTIIDSRKRIARTAIAPKLRQNPYCTQFVD
jgi:hypothetical protein